jgi:2-polyprenyl-6-methoxyphenol hydroxylase-like FAD-dependent oxidoreductase
MRSSKRLTYRRFRVDFSTLNRSYYPVCIVGGGPVGLLMSIMLSDYGVDHCIVERRLAPTAHPQAHFVNCRSMEVLQSDIPEAFRSVLPQVPHSTYWRDFSYCHSVTGRQLIRVDHFTDTNSKFWDQSPTNIIHLPQNRFEAIMRSEVQRRQLRQDGAKRDSFFGFEAFGFRYLDNKCQLHIRQSQSASVSNQKPQTESTCGSDSGSDNRIITPTTIQCDFLIAADGASSPIRNSLGISLNGNSCLQTLMNVHFTCEGLFQKLRPRPAMLYFVFNETTVSVFVAHDPLKDEWVCQIPIFPPFRSPQVRHTHLIDCICICASCE